MNFVLELLLLLAYAIVLWLLYYKQIHMFQQNGYKFATHLKWVKKNLSSNVFKLYFGFKAKAKKPLAHTPRVKRMTITFLLLMAVFFTLDKQIFHFRVAYFSIALLLLSPITPVILNFINYPIESLVRRYFIEDAKKILDGHTGLIKIGITGSFGKTSVKYFLSQMLKEKYSVLMTPESYNTPMGIAMTIRGQLRATHEVFVCEMGARQKGDITALCEMVQPKIGIITSIGEQHLETFKTKENIYLTKMELSAYTDSLYVNLDSPMIAKNYPGQFFFTYGTNEEAGHRAVNICVSKKGTTFDFICERGDIMGLSTRLIGAANIVNLSAAISVSLAMGLDEAQIRRALLRIEPVAHRQQLCVIDGSVIIDDAYNSNPLGAESALETLSLFDGLKVLITPGMVELGAMEDACNKTFGIQAAKVCDKVILVGKNQTKSIYAGLLEGGFSKDAIRVEESFNAAFTWAQSLNGKKVILIENDLPDNY